MSSYHKKQVNVVAIIVLLLNSMAYAYATPTRHAEEISNMVAMVDMVAGQNNHKHSNALNNTNCTCTDNCSLFCDCCEPACSHHHSSLFLSIFIQKLNRTTETSEVISFYETSSIVLVSSRIFRPPINSL